jgi:negative regulator of flagellin synthesis FlgM
MFKPLKISSFKPMKVPSLVDNNEMRSFKMTIEISPLNNSAIRQEDQRQVDNTQNKPILKSNSQSASKAEDMVHITHGLNDIKRVQEMIQNTPVVDPQKVETIKQALNSGTYQINSDAVAKKIMAFENILQYEMVE